LIFSAGKAIAPDLDNFYSNKVQPSASTDIALWHLSVLLTPDEHRYQPSNFKTSRGKMISLVLLQGGLTLLGCERCRRQMGHETPHERGW